MSAPLPVLVTGGAGYIGSHACKALAEAGYLPVTLDNLRDGSRDAVRWGPLIEARVGDRARLKQLFAEYKFIAIMHFAGLIEVGQSALEPRAYFDCNVTETLVLLDVALDAGIRRFIFASSCAVYGAVEHTPIPESAPCRPMSVYGQTKLMVEEILAAYDRAYDLRSVTLRYFNAAGADPGGEIGECHGVESHLIPLAIAAASGGKPLNLFGEDYPTPDGTPIRDYVHVTDLANGHVAALQYLQGGGESQICNLGTGQGYSVRQVLAAVETVIGQAPRSLAAPRRPGDAPMLFADPTRARAVLNWQPRHSDLMTIVETAARWHASRA